MSERYRIVFEPQDHFMGCDRWVIVDTTKRGYFGEGKWDYLAECHSEQIAKLICHALNQNSGGSVE